MKYCNSFKVSLLPGSRVYYCNMACAWAEERTVNILLDRAFVEFGAEAATLQAVRRTERGTRSDWPRQKRYVAR